MKEEDIIIENLHKNFPAGAGNFQALTDISLRIPQGSLTALTGKSGSGKTTLLNMIAGIDRPTKGRITVAGRAIEALSEDELAGWRGKNVGIVFQFFQLLPTLTILENVVLPMDFCRIHKKSQRSSKALELLRVVGIADQAHKFPAALSGGQQQRAAIARALANDPPIVVADEPTGNLDSQTAETIFALFQSLAQSGKTVLIVTHENAFAKYFQKVFSISDGRIHESADTHWKGAICSVRKAKR